ncbi:MAG: response regulator [Bradymonadales bacterium]|nr:response regulator [Bradymonadales bacterium]
MSQPSHKTAKDGVPAEILVEMGKQAPKRERANTISGQYVWFSRRGRSLMGGLIRLALIATGFGLLLAIGVRDRLLLSLILVFLILASLALILIAKDKLPVQRLYLLLTLDVLAISVIAWAIGAQTSALRYGYVIIVVGYTLQRNPKIGLVALVFSLAGYLSVLVLEELGIIPRAPLATGVLEPHTVLGGLLGAFLFPACVLVATYVFLSFVVKHMEMHMEEERRLMVSERDAQERALQMKASLDEARRLESLGRLAGGVAHDFNNLLTAILGYADCVRLDLPPHHPSAPDLDHIVTAARRASKLTSELLAFSRKQIVELKAIDLSQVVQSALDVLQRIIGEDIEISVSLSEDLWPVKADPDRLHQVLLNLALNARDAMPDGGLLAIETANRSVTEEEQAALSVLSPGDYVLLCVQDQGSGMDEDTLNHIFEPFFTTKEKGKGTGLGLATVYGIVKQHQGHITVQSRSGQGSRFCVFLPRAERTDAYRPPPPVDQAPGGSETILVVEDEDSVRDLTRRYLETAGYRVLVAASGEEALQIATDFSEPIHLLLTDVVLTGISGKVLAERLAGTRPDTAVLYMSGYTDDVIARQGILDATISLIQKPFARMELLARVKQALLAGPGCPPDENGG